MKKALLLIPFMMASPAFAATIDFESWAGGSGVMTSATLNGFNILGSDSNFIIAPLPVAYNSNDTTTVLTKNNAGGGVININKGGDLFNFLGVDIQEGNLATPSTSLSITAFFPVGLPITQTFSLDGTAKDFQTMNFSQFNGLTAVWLSTTGGSQQFAIDNLVLPEPCTASLLLVVTVFFRRASGHK